VGATVRVELTATDDPFKVALVAFVVVHERVVDPPDATDEGLARMTAVGAGLLESYR